MNHYAIEKYGFAEYAEEIIEYVLNDKTPERGRLRAMIDEFDTLHRKWGRDLY
ncbi:MAG: hypothetical protein JXL84_03460 [Deltaproteobacteria bacterium]|nr:hypothetical protein [Deltaproteobacteria bacterium]